MNGSLIPIDQYATAFVAGEEVLVYVRSRYSATGGNPASGRSLTVRVEADDPFDTCINENQIVEWC